MTNYINQIMPAIKKHMTNNNKREHVRELLLEEQTTGVKSKPQNENQQNQQLHHQ